jgi:hypothetical protein
MTNRRTIPSSLLSNMEKAELEHITVGETDDALITLKNLDGSQRDPITDEEQRKVLRKIDFWMMPIVISPL